MLLRKVYFLALAFGLFSCIFACTGDKQDTRVFTLKIRSTAEATNFNPLLPMPGYSRFVCQDVFYTLGTIDYKTLQMQPLMVKKIPEARTVAKGPNQGALAYDFELWEEAVWDDGKPITAKDFVFSLELIFHPYLPMRAWRGYFEQVQDVQIDGENPKKFTVFLKEYYILGLESLCQFPIFPAHHYDPEGAMKDVPITAILNEKQGELWAQADSLRQKDFATFFTSEKTISDTAFVMGAGPYRLAAIIPGEGTVLQKKDPWWGDAVGSKNPYLRAFPQRIEYRFLKDEGAVENTLRNGDLDVIPSMAMQKFLELKEDPTVNADYNFELVDFLGYNYWLLNNRNPILSDLRVRRALAHVVEYDYLGQEVYFGMYQRIVGPIHPLKDYFNTEIQPYQHDFAKAKALLAEAGWTDSDGDGLLDKTENGQKKNFSLTVITSNRSESSKAIAECVQHSCKKIGIDLKIDWKDISDIVKDTRSGNFDCSLLATAQYPGLDDLYQTFHSESLAPAGDNRMGYSSPEADRIIEAIRVESDAKKRKALYFEIQKVLHNDVPVVFLGAPKERVIVSKKFDAAITPNRPNFVAPYFQVVPNLRD